MYYRLLTITSTTTILDIGSTKFYRQDRQTVVFFPSGSDLFAYMLDDLVSIQRELIQFSGSSAREF